MNLKDFYDKLSSKRAIDQVTDLANDPILVDIVQSYMKKFVSHITATLGRFYKSNPRLQNAEKAISSTDYEVMLKGVVTYLQEIYTQVDPTLVPNSLRNEALSYELIVGYKEVAKMAPLTREILGFNMTQDYAYFDTTPRLVITNTKDGSEKFQGYPSWSGVDMTVVAIMGSAMRFLPDLSTISFSINRDKVDVKALGRATRTGVTSGTRIISGSMIGVALKDEPFRSIAPTALNQNAGNDQLQSAFNPYREHMLPDQLPLFDILILIQNEYGHYARIGLFGISFVGNGQVVSINDMQTEITYTYTATDIDLLTYGGSSKENIQSLAIALDAYKERRDRISNGQSLHNSSFDVPNFWDVWDPEKRMVMSPQDYYKTVSAVTTTETHNKKTGAEQAVKDLQLPVIYPPVEFFGDPSQEDGFIARVPPECEFPIKCVRSFDTDAFTQTNDPIYTNTVDTPYFHPLQPFELNSCINTNKANSKDSNQLLTGSMFHSSTFTYIKDFHHGYGWNVHKVGMDLWKSTKQTDAYVLFNIHDPFSKADTNSPINEAVYLTGLDIYYTVGERKDFVLPYTEDAFVIDTFDESTYQNGYKTYNMLNDFGKLKKIKITYFEQPNGSNQLGDPVEITIESSHLKESKKTSPAIPNSVVSLTEAELKVPTSVTSKNKLVKSIKIEIVEVEWPTSGPDALSIAAIIPKGKLLSMAKVSIKKQIKEKEATFISIKPTKEPQPNVYDYASLSASTCLNVIRSANVFTEIAENIATFVGTNKAPALSNELINSLTGLHEKFPRETGVGVCLGANAYRAYSNKQRWTAVGVAPTGDAIYSNPSIAVNMALDGNQLQLGTNNNYNNLTLLKKVTFSKIKTISTNPNNNVSAIWPLGDGTSITDAAKNDLSLHGYIGLILYKNHPCFYKDNYFTGIATYSSIRRLSYVTFLQRSSTAFGELIKDYAKRKKATPFVADVNEILPTNDMLNAHPLYSLLYKELPRIADNHNGPERSCVLVRTTYLSAKTSSAPQITFNNHVYVSFIFNHIENTTGKNLYLKYPADYYWRYTPDTQLNDDIVRSNYYGAVDAWGSAATNDIKVANKANILHGIPIENVINGVNYVSSYSSVFDIECKTS